MGAISDPLPAPPDGVYPSQILFASRESGWPGDGTPEDYLEALARALVSANRLYNACIKALYIREKNTLVEEIEQFEFVTDDKANSGSISVQDTRAIMRLFRLHAVPAELQAELLNLPLVAIDEEYENGNLGLSRYKLGPDILWWQAQGYTPSQIGEKIGRSKQFVYEVLKKSGLTPNKKGKLEPTKREIYEDEVVKLWNKGYTCEHIRTILKEDISADYIRQIVTRARKNGKKVRFGPHRPAPPQTRKKGKTLAS